MITTSISDFLSLLSADRPILGLDVGTKRIGIACSNPQVTIAFPRDVYSRINRRKDMGYFARISGQEHAAGIVIGLPLTLDNQESEHCVSIRQFAERLCEKTRLPVLLLDERMSTAAVTRVMKEAGVKRQRRHEKDDQLAACYLLQTVIEVKKPIG